MLIFQNAEGVHGQRKIGNLCYKRYVKTNLSCYILIYLALIVV